MFTNFAIPNCLVVHPTNRKWVSSIPWNHQGELTHLNDSWVVRHQVVVVAKHHFWWIWMMTMMGSDDHHSWFFRSVTRLHCSQVYSTGAPFWAVPKAPWSLPMWRPPRPRPLWCPTSPSRWPIKAPRVLENGGVFVFFHGENADFAAGFLVILQGNCRF